MTEDELHAFLRAQRTVAVATNGRRGWPHVTPLWYVTRDTGPAGAPELWAWTYAKSQKVRNLERDRRATLQIETGDTYGELQGAMLECDVEIVRDPDALAQLARELFARTTPGGLNDEVLAVAARQAPKRVGLRFVMRRAATWDHRKLAGAY
jgi:general stress protein 26